MDSPAITGRLVTGPAGFAAAAASRLAALITGAQAGGRSLALVLSGGETPAPVYRQLARLKGPDWRRVDIFFGDERAVPPNDPASNFRMAQENLIGPAGIPPGQVHRMEADDPDPHAAAQRYAALLPGRLDLVLLGIGEDGHTLSLFPGAPALQERNLLVVPVTGPKPPPRRLTLTPAALLRAAGTVVLAAGAGKAPAVAQALEGPYAPADCPAQLAREGLWILDRLAAAGLADPKE